MILLRILVVVVQMVVIAKILIYILPYANIFLLMVTYLCIVMFYILNLI